MEALGATVEATRYAICAIVLVALLCECPRFPHSNTLSSPPVSSLYSKKIQGFPSSYLGVFTLLLQTSVISNCSKILVTIFFLHVFGISAIRI